MRELQCLLAQSKKELEGLEAAGKIISGSSEILERLLINKVDRCMSYLDKLEAGGEYKAEEFSLAFWWAGSFGKAMDNFGAYSKLSMYKEIDRYVMLFW